MPNNTLNHVWNILIPLGAAILGAIIGGGLTGYFTLRAVKDNYANQLNFRENEDKKQRTNVISAIYFEIKSLRKVYEKGMGSIIDELPKDEPLLWFYPIIEDYFTVFNNNTQFIGKLNRELAHSIIEFYILSKSLADSFRLNNSLFEKYNYYCSIFEETQNPFYEQKRNKELENLRSYAPQIKRCHLELKTKSQVLLTRLNDYKKV